MATGLDRNGYAPSIMQSDRECYITGCGSPLVRHEIYYGTGRRELSKIYGCWVYLRPDWHNTGDYGVHGSKGYLLDQRLKKECQQVFEETRTRKQFVRLFGRSYL